MKLRSAALAGVALLALASGPAALAQSTATPVATGYLSTTGCSYGQTSCWLQYGPGFNASGQATLTASTSSSNVALGSTGPQIIVSNGGAVTAYVALGGSGVTATTSSIPVLPGFPILLQTGAATYIAGITGSSTASLTITSGTGVPSGIGAAQPISGTVTANQGSAGAAAWPVVSAQSGTNPSVTPTIQNASYVSGNCMGGFQTVAMGTIASVLSQISLSSKGGLATAKQLYVFSANPSSSTCTDKGTFTLAAADVSKILYEGSITPTAPIGTTVTTGFASNLSLGIPSGGTVYLAIVETTTETPASASDLVANFSGY